MTLFLLRYIIMKSRRRRSRGGNLTKKTHGMKKTRKWKYKDVDELIDEYFNIANKKKLLDKDDPLYSNKKIKLTQTQFFIKRALGKKDPLLLDTLNRINIKN